MNIGMRAHDFPTTSITALSEKCKEYDIKCIQLALAKSMPDIKPGMFSPEFAKYIKAELDKNNVSIGVLGCYINPVDCNEGRLKDSLAYFVENLKYARFLNAGMVGLETGFVGEAPDAEKDQSEEAYQKLLKNMRYLTDNAEKLGVMIGIEGVSCFVINSLQKMKRIIDDLNSPNILTIFDPINYLNDSNYQNQDKIIEEAFELLGDRMAAIHVKDYDVVDGHIKGVVPGDGRMNFELLISLAEKYKPNIPFLLEGVTEENINKVREMLLSKAVK